MNNKRWIILIVSFSLIVRILVNWPVFQDQDKSLHNDSYIHLKISKNLVAGNGFSHCNVPPYHKNTFITPAYPTFISVIEFLFGGDKRFIILSQILIDILILYLLFLLGVEIFSFRISLIAAILYATSSHAMTYTGFVTTETLFSLFLLILVYVSIKIPSKYLVWSTPILWFLLLLIRPIAIYLLPILMVYSFLKFKRKKIINSSIILILSGAIILPRVNSIYQLTERYSVSSIQEYNLYFTFANAFLAKKNKIGEEEQRSILENKLTNPLFSDCSGNYSYVKECGKKGSEILRRNLISYVFLHLSEVPNVFIPEITLIGERWGLSEGGKGTLSVINKEGWIAGFKHYYDGNYFPFIIMLPLFLIWIFTMVLFLIGIILISAKILKKELFLLAGIIIYFIIIPGPAGNGRFLFPVIPYVLLISANGLDAIIIIYLNKKKLKRLQS